MKKKTTLAALALILFGVNVAFAVNYFMISNMVKETATASETNLIQITVFNFPPDINFGKNYTFTVVTENLADQELTGLQSFITIQYNDTDGDPQVLGSSWFYIYYNDSGSGDIGPWEGPIQGTFLWDETNEYLISANEMGGGDWSAPEDYKNTAEVTFRIDACVDLPDGTLTWEAWVEAPLG